MSQVSAVFTALWENGWNTAGNATEGGSGQSALRYWEVGNTGRYMLGPERHVLEARGLLGDWEGPRVGIVECLTMSDSAFQNPPTAPPPQSFVHQ